MVEHSCDLVHTGFFDTLERFGHSSVPQGNVEYRPVLGGVDMFPAKHVIPALFDLCLSGQGKQGIEDLLVDEVLGVVEQDGDIGPGGRGVGSVEVVEAGGIRVEEILEDELVLLALVQLLEFGP